MEEWNEDGSIMFVEWKTEIWLKLRDKREIQNLRETGIVAQHSAHVHVIRY